MQSHQNVVVVRRAPPGELPWESHFAPGVREYVVREREEIDRAKYAAHRPAIAAAIAKFTSAHPGSSLREVCLSAGELLLEVQPQSLFERAIFVLVPALGTGASARLWDDGRTLISLGLDSF